MYQTRTTHHHDHRVVLPEGAVEAEEGDEEDDDAGGDAERRQREEPVREELMVPVVRVLNRTAHGQNNNARYLKTPSQNCITHTTRPI